MANSSAEIYGAFDWAGFTQRANEAFQRFIDQVRPVVATMADFISSVVKAVEGSMSKRNLANFNNRIKAEARRETGGQAMIHAHRRKRGLT